MSFVYTNYCSCTMNLPVVHIGKKLTHSESEGDSDTEISGGPPKQVKGELEQVTVHMCCIPSQVVLRFSSAEYPPYSTLGTL